MLILEICGLSTAAAGWRGINGLFGAKWPNKSSTPWGFPPRDFRCVCGRSRPRNSSATTRKTQQAFRKEFFERIVAGNFRAGFDLQMDQLTVVMSSSSQASAS